MTKRRKAKEEYGYSAIARKLFEHALEDDSKSNISLCPFSFVELMSMIMESANSQTRDEIVRALGRGKTYEKVINEVFARREELLKGDSITSANAICVNKEFSESIKNSCIGKLKEHFDAEIFASDRLAVDVNAWAQNKTKGMISNLMNPGEEIQLAMMLNAFAFEAEWEKAYTDNKISERVFHNVDKSESMVTMLESYENLLIDNERFVGFVKPYKDPDYSFMALLPRKEKDSYRLDKVIKDLNLTELYKSASYGSVGAFIPEYEITGNYDLTKACESLGIKKAFTDAADLSPLFSERMKIEAVKQKVFIKVDRHGTKAAAISAAFLIGGGCVLGFPTVIMLDRPFVYAVMHNKTELPVFMGVVNRFE